MTLKQWIIELFRDERGATSIKPVIAFFLSLSIGIALIISSIKRDVIFSDALVNAIMVVICVAIGGDTVDKFTFKKKPDETTE